MGILVDSAIMIGSMFIFFIGGWVWFVRKIFRDYEVHNTLVQLFFPMIFMLSCAMFELIIFEIAAVLESGSRYLYWQVVLYLMLVMLILVIPFYLCHCIISNIRMVRREWVNLLAMVTWGGFMMCFWKIGDPFPILSPQHGILSIEQSWQIHYFQPLLIWPISQACEEVPRGVSKPQGLGRSSQVDSVVIHPTAA